MHGLAPLCLDPGCPGIRRDSGRTGSGSHAGGLRSPDRPAQWVAEDGRKKPASGVVIPFVAAGHS